MVLSFLSIVLCCGCSSVTGTPARSSAEVEGGVYLGSSDPEAQTNAVGESVPEDGEGSDSSAGNAEPDEETVVYIHIAGAVCDPGVYALSPQSRLIEAVNAAGGFTKEADETYLNLAEQIADGTRYYVPTMEETEALTAGGGGALDNARMGVSEPSVYDSQGRLDINLAGVKELMELDGIGESKANAIIAYREEHGSFSDTRGLMQVSGIGEGTYERLKDSIVVR